MTQEQQPSEDPNEPDPELEPPRPRRRARLTYRSAERSMMADQVLILMALLVAFFMVYSRGCQSSFDGLTRLLTEEVPAQADAGATEPAR
ncbi:MAG: hypothetical protein CVU59_06090 [Deltaproteobacteria bacterium HGW-Deltaproteobacteria-17]|nr:MAG: hypothetical protein CVU59_06090 [Deltaproteobacteria bacterium HGW-Deltaproteobacteria-17]